MFSASLICFVLMLSATLASSLDVCPECGTMEVPYPLSTNQNCGDPKYRIYCNNGNLEFKSAKGFYYKILRISPSDNKLILSPPHIEKSSCYSSDFALGGLQLDESLPFNISTHNTVMLFNCSENMLLSPLNCSSASICRQFEDQVEEASACKGTLCCHYLKDSAMTSHMIRVRVEGCTAYTSLVGVNPGNDIGAWNYGIELQWLLPN